MPAYARKADARPTKEFFIGMLTRDIELPRAIIDLVDNSIDGALKLRPPTRAKRPYEGLHVRLDLSPDEFRIADNCGGIDIVTAEKYAFRFGRPEDFDEVPHSIGQFGVGMKRALFKLGTFFRVESSTTTSRFVIQVDVGKWKSTDQWDFPFTELDEDTHRPLEDTGTTIAVSPLHASVSERFSLENFCTKLAEDIAIAHQINMDKGLVISLNQVPLDFRGLNLLETGKLKPALKASQYDKRSGSPVRVKIYVGVADSIPDEAGWYVFCNGRLVLEADKSLVTGWGSDSERTIPRYHNQFARFRGYVFFDCDVASKLPWNTTKTGVDAESAIYTTVLNEMIQLMRPAIDFLNRLKEEREGDQGDEGPLSAELLEANSVDIGESATRDTFTYPKIPPRPLGPRTTRISYEKPADQVEKAKDALGVTSNPEVGRQTFDYFYMKEVKR